MTDQTPEPADAVRRQRWRLLLGEGSERLGELSGPAVRQSALLDFLYDRENPSHTARRGGSGPSALTVPEWINDIRELFPKRTVELLQGDALDRYHMVEVVTDKDALERVEPSPTLLKAILQTKHLMNDEVLAAARQIVRKVARQMVENLKPQIRQAITGRRNPHRRSRFRSANDFDAKATIRANLKNWSAERGQLVIHEPIFASRTRRHTQRWQVIIAVDQSGSMAGSVIHSAVMASIFHGMAQFRTHLVVFDTEVVDLTADVQDPVETLMKVQLGGGTNIARAMLYCESLVQTPSRTLVVLITDLCEGGDVGQLLGTVSRLCRQGSTVLVLAALDQDGAAVFDLDLGRRLEDLGAHVGAMTPFELAEWVAQVIG